MTGCDISPAESIKSLGVTLDSEISLCKHVGNICKTSHYHIRALRHIRQSVDLETAKTIECVIVGSRLDYYNSILHSTSAGNLKRLQTVQNTLARVVFGKKKIWQDHTNINRFTLATSRPQNQLRNRNHSVQNQNSPPTRILRQSTRWLQTAENTQIICRRTSRGSPYSNSGMLGLEAWPRPRGQKTWPQPRPRGLWPRPWPRPRGFWPRPRGFWPRVSRPLEAYSPKKQNGMWLEVNQLRILRSLSCRCELQASFTLSVKHSFMKTFRSLIYNFH